MCTVALQICLTYLCPAKQSAIVP